MKRVIIPLAIIAIVLIAGGVFFFNSGSSPAQVLPSGETSAPASVAAPVPEITAGAPAPDQPSAKKEFIVTGQNFSFSPAELAVKQGDRVRITFKNAEGFHDLRMDDFNAATQRVGAGREDAIEFTAGKTGSFEYYCSVGNHRAMGMRGTLVVE